MENYKAILQQQKDALEKDIEVYKVNIQTLELNLETEKDLKTKANSQLRSIIKKLEKL